MYIYSSMGYKKEGKKINLKKRVAQGLRSTGRTQKSFTKISISIFLWLNCFLCISCGSNNITKRINKKNIKKTMFLWHSYIASFKENNNFDHLAIWLADMWVSKQQHQLFWKLRFLTFTVSFNNIHMTCLSNHLYQKKFSISFHSFRLFSW